MKPYFAAGILLFCALSASAQRDFDAEINEATLSAKRASGFEFLGTLSRLCILPPRNSPNTSNDPPGYVTDPSTAPRGRSAA